MKNSSDPLSKRARQVLDELYRVHEASAAELLVLVPDLPSYSAARSVLRGLQERGLVDRRAEGLKYVYRPAKSRSQASRTALKKVLQTFFDDSPEKTMRALVDLSRERGEAVDWESLERLVSQAREDDE